MSKGKLILGEPAIRLESDKAVLYIKVNDTGEQKELRYIMDANYQQYMVTERSDAFVVPLLYYAMIKDYDVEWVVPCTAQRIYQLETFYIPAFHANCHHMNEIKLIGPTTEEALPTENAVGTGLSAGVDSLYTIHKYLNYDKKQYALTHVFFTDWFNTDKSKAFIEEFWNINTKKLQILADDLGLEFVKVKFNIDEEFSIGEIADKKRGLLIDQGFYTLKYCAIPMALAKLFSKYYFSSGRTVKDFSFARADFASHDIFAMPMISTDQFNFYSSGCEKERIDKVFDIADWEIAQKYLDVCMFPLEDGTNCGCCKKCKRTMLELYIAGHLDEYTTRFPVEKFKQTFAKQIAYQLAHAKYSHDDFARRSINRMKGKNIKIPMLSYVLAPVYIMVEIVRKKLRRNKLARRIYLKFGLDCILYERSLKHYRKENV